MERNSVKVDEVTYYSKLHLCVRSMQTVVFGHANKIFNGSWPVSRFNKHTFVPSTGIIIINTRQRDCLFLILEPFDRMCTQAHRFLLIKIMQGGCTTYVSVHTTTYLSICFTHVVDNTLKIVVNGLCDYTAPVIITGIKQVKRDQILYVTLYFPIHYLWFSTL